MSYRLRPGSAPLVVLIHGSRCDASDWDGVVEALSGRALLIPDLCGHGESGAPAVPVTFDSFADDIIAVVEHVTGITSGAPSVPYLHHGYSGTALDGSHSDAPEYSGNTQAQPGSSHSTPPDEGGNAQARPGSSHSTPPDEGGNAQAQPGSSLSTPPDEGGNAQARPGSSRSELPNEDGDEGAVLAGHSLGGMLALRVLERRPDLVRGAALLEGWTRLGLQGAVDWDLFGELDPATVARVLQRNEATFARWPEGAHDDFWSTVRSADAQRVLETTSAPILQCYGDRGQPRPRPTDLAVPERSNIEFRWFAGAAHYLPLERPGAVGEAIEGWIRSSGCAG